MILADWIRLCPGISKINRNKNSYQWPMVGRAVEAQALFLNRNIKKDTLKSTKNDPGIYNF